MGLSFARPGSRRSRRKLRAMQLTRRRRFMPTSSAFRSRMPRPFAKNSIPRRW
jgi:hypothetical protein